MKYINLTFIILTIFFSSCSSNNENGNFKTIGFEEFTKVLDENKNIVIIDVRTNGEILSGKIKNSLEIDFYKSDFTEKLNKLDKTKTYLVYCRSGNRSGKTLKIMEKLGFKIVYDLAGGIGTLNKNSYPLI